MVFKMKGASRHITSELFIELAKLYASYDEYHIVVGYDLQLCYCVYDVTGKCCVRTCFPGLYRFV